MFQNASQEYAQVWDQIDFDKEITGHIKKDANGEVSYTATVVNLSRIKKSVWESNPNMIYIGRENEGLGLAKSKWANNNPPNKDRTLEESLRMYEENIKASPLATQLGELKGKILGCWCSPKSCHGDVLLDLIGE